MKPHTLCTDVFSCVMSLVIQSPPNILVVWHGMFWSKIGATRVTTAGCLGSTSYGNVQKH